MCENEGAMVICLLMEACWGYLTAHSSPWVWGMCIHNYLKISTMTLRAEMSPPQNPTEAKAESQTTCQHPQFISVLAGTENPWGRSFIVSACCMPLQSGKIHGPFPDCLQMHKIHRIKKRRAITPKYSSQILKSTFEKWSYTCFLMKLR